MPTGYATPPRTEIVHCLALITDLASEPRFPRKRMELPLAWARYLLVAEDRWDPPADALSPAERDELIATSLVIASRARDVRTRRHLKRKRANRKLPSTVEILTDLIEPITRFLNDRHWHGSAMPSDHRECIGAMLTCIDRHGFSFAFGRLEWKHDPKHLPPKGEEGRQATGDPDAT